MLKTLLPFWLLFRVLVLPRDRKKPRCAELQVCWHKHHRSPWNPQSRGWLEADWEGDYIRWTVRIVTGDLQSAVSTLPPQWNVFGFLHPTLAPSGVVRPSFFFLSLFIYFEGERERERERAQAGVGQRKGTRENPEQAPFYQCRAWHGAQTHELWDHDLSRNQESDTTDWATRAPHSSSFWPPN